jgi:ribosomal-protein-alanine N-acetyltransferase
MIIREMTMEDLDRVYAIEVDSYLSPWTREMFVSELTSNKYAYLFVLEYNKIIIGYYGFWAIDENAMITKVTIAKPLRGKGLAKIAMNDLLKRLVLLDSDSVSLEVRVSNAVAINLYNSMGFKNVGMRKHYYNDGEDAYVMVKRFDKGEEVDEETYIRN